jgi:TIR domain
VSASPTIFLSYAREDHRCGERLAATLSGRGLSVWWDRNIRAGRSYERVIEEALSEAQIVVVLWSRSSVESDWVRAEASYALEANKLLPLNIDGTRLPLRFRPVQTLDLRTWDEAEESPEWAILFEEIAARLEQSEREARAAEEARLEAERLRLAEEAAHRERHEREAEEARQRAEQEQAEREARAAEEARREAERQRLAEETARREREEREAEEARQRAEQEQAKREARAAEEARREADRQRLAEETARREEEEREAEGARQRAEQEQAEFAARRAEQARREAERQGLAEETARRERNEREAKKVRNAPEQPDKDQEFLKESECATRNFSLVISKYIKNITKADPLTAKVKIVRVSFALSGAAVSFLALLTSDCPSRGEIAPGTVVAPSASAPSHALPPTGMVAQPAAKPAGPLAVAPPPPKTAASGLTSEAAGPVAVTPPSSVEPPFHAASEPAWLRPGAPRLGTAPTRSVPSPVEPSRGAAPGEVAMAVPGPTSLFLPRLETAKPSTEIAPSETSFRTIVATPLRQQPEKSGKRLADLASDTEVMIADSGTSGDWYKVEVPSRQLIGFVEANTVRETSVLEAAEWQRIRNRSDTRSFTSFLRRYPQGAHAKAASDRLKILHRAAAAVVPVLRPGVRPKPREYDEPSTSETLSSGRCASIIERSQLGEELTDADRAILKNNCH